MVKCPKCGYKDAEKTVSYKKTKGWGHPASLAGHSNKYDKTISWTCPKCNFEKEKTVEIDSVQYLKESGEGERIGKIEEARARSWHGSCCMIGLIPTTILFIPFMTVFPNQNFMLSMIDFHKKRTSPVLNKHNFKCGFTPSCSEYSKIAIKKYGAFKGGLKSLWRLARCNPLNKNKGIEYP